MSAARFEPLRSAAAPGWLGENAAVHLQFGTPETIAQVTPDLFTQAMLTASGAALIGGASMGSSSMVAARPAFCRRNPWRLTRCYRYGPWFILAYQWLTLPGVYGLKGHSFMFRHTPETPRALFVESEDHAGERSTPEVMPRPDGITYVLLVRQRPPVDPAHVGTEEGGPENFELYIPIRPRAGCRRSRCPACYRPVTQDSMPVIGAVTGVEGAYAATGHSGWGMLNGTATGEAIGELIVDGAASTVDISPRTRTATGPRCGCTLRTKLKLPLLSVRPPP